MDLSAPVLPRFNLAPQARGLARCATVSGHVVSLQTVEPFLASADQAQPGAHRVVASGGSYATSPRSLQEAVGPRRCVARKRWSGNIGGCLRGAAFSPILGS